MAPDRAHNFWRPVHRQGAKDLKIDNSGDNFLYALSNSLMYLLLKIKILKICKERLKICQNVYITDQNNFCYLQKWNPKKTGFWPFSNAKMYARNGLSLKSRWKKWGHFSSFLVLFLTYGPEDAKNTLFAILTWHHQKSTNLG